MDEDQESHRQYSIRDGLIFLLELNEGMLLPLKLLGGQSPIFEVLSSINQLVQDQVIANPGTGVGVFFYNSDSTDKNLPQNARISKLFRLHELNLKDMRKLNFLLEDEILGFSKIKDRFPPSEENIVDLNQVFLLLLEEFQTVNAKSFNRKKLLWFTNNDNPYGLKLYDENPKLLEKLRETASNYYNLMIPIIPIFLNKTDGTPFGSKFYEEMFLNTSFLSLKNKMITEKPTLVEDQIRSTILGLKYVNRVQFACNIVLSDGKIGGKVGCAVRGYTLYNHEKPRKVSHIYDKAEKITIVHLEGKITRKDTGQEIELLGDNTSSFEEQKQDAGIRKGIELKYKSGNETGSDILYLNNQQMDFLKQFTFDHSPSTVKEDSDSSSEDDLESSESPFVALSNAPYLKLLGFRHISKFQPYYNMSSPVFITYDASNGSNSGLGYENLDVTFRSLYKSCVKLERYAVIFGCTKRNASPNLYALYPTNVAKSSRVDNFPDGFLLIKIPWLDDIRSLPTHLVKEPSFSAEKDDFHNDLVSKFSVLLDAFHILDYKPSSFQNPSLNYFYEIMRNDLLQIENKEFKLEDYDNTYTLLNNISAKLNKDDLAKVTESIKVRLSNEYPDIQPLAGEPPQKKAKVVEIRDEDILTAWKRGELDTFTVPQLKAFVSSYKNSIKSATKKQDLINNITSFLESRKTS